MASCARRLPIRSAIPITPRTAGREMTSILPRRSAGSRAGWPSIHARILSSITLMRLRRKNAINAEKMRRENEKTVFAIAARFRSSRTASWMRVATEAACTLSAMSPSAAASSGPSVTIGVLPTKTTATAPCSSTFGVATSASPSSRVPRASLAARARSVAVCPARGTLMVKTSRSCTRTTAGALGFALLAGAVSWSAAAEANAGAVGCSVT